MKLCAKSEKQFAAQPHSDCCCGGDSQPAQRPLLLVEFPEMRSEWATESTGLWGTVSTTTSPLKNCVLLGGICKVWVIVCGEMVLEGLGLSPYSTELNGLINDGFLAGKPLSPTSLD